MGREHGSVVAALPFPLPFPLIFSLPLFVVVASGCTLVVLAASTPLRWRLVFLWSLDPAADDALAPLDADAVADAPARVRFERAVGLLAAVVAACAVCVVEAPALVVAAAAAARCRVRLRLATSMSR